jgi:quercetin dioxygenase-like cupin family protein
MFTLGPEGGGTPGALKVADIGPIPIVSASEYSLRVNNAGGPPGSQSPVHTHPGSETFYVLTGQVTQKIPGKINKVDAGDFMVGRGADTPMQVLSSGANDLSVLVLFVVDASRPFSSPAKF